MRDAGSGSRGETSPMVTLGLAPLAGAGGPGAAAGALGGVGALRLRGAAGVQGAAPSHPLEPDSPRLPAHAGRGPDDGLDVLEAFARGHLLTFGLRTLLRGPPVVVGLLAALLVPWTVLLALAEPWHFPAAWVRWAWVAFDVVLAAALFRLVLRWSNRLSRVVVAAVGADAAVTVGEVLLWNVPRIRGVADALVSLVAVSAPSLAFVILWRARVRRHAPP